MKKLLLLGAALLGVFCAVGRTARAGEDGPAYSDDRPAPRHYEDRPHYYYPPPPPVYFAPPFIGYYGYPRHHRRVYPYAYGYGYRRPFAPGVYIGF